MSRITGVILAAGLSRRMGQAKVNLPFADTTLAGWVLREALQSDLERIIVVVNNEEMPWLGELNMSLPKRVNVIRCEYPDRGQSESIKCGIEALKGDEDGFMILLADQPFFPGPEINRVIKFYKIHTTTQQVDYVASRYVGIARPPAIFSMKMKSYFQQLTGDAGAKGVFKNTQYHGLFVDYQESRYFLDVDTPQDYETAKAIENRIE